MINVLKYMAIATSFGLGIRRATSLLRCKFSKTQRYSVGRDQILSFKSTLDKLLGGAIYHPQRVIMFIHVRRGYTSALMMVWIGAIGCSDVRPNEMHSLISAYSDVFRKTVDTNRIYNHQDMQLRFVSLMVKDLAGNERTPHAEHHLGGIGNVNITETPLWNKIKMFQRELLYAHNRWKSSHRDCDVSALRIIR